VPLPTACDLDLDELRDDAALARGLIARHAGAHSVLWERYRCVVRAVMRRVLGPDPAADDLSQEVFLRLTVHVHTLRDPSALRSFVLSVAFHVARRELRRRRRAEQVVVLSETGEPPDTAQAFASADWEHAKTVLWRTLVRLKPREQRVLRSRHLEGMTVEEIARSMRLSITTVKRTLKAASLRARRLAGEEPLEAFHG
jgi:RNA polymerase sigma-70 factor, ECF subfamily